MFGPDFFGQFSKPVCFYYNSAIHYPPPLPPTHTLIPTTLCAYVLIIMLVTIFGAFKISKRHHWFNNYGLFANYLSKKWGGPDPPLSDPPSPLCQPMSAFFNPPPLALSALSAYALPPLPE